MDRKLTSVGEHSWHDEEWNLPEDTDPDTFYHGWFKDKKGKLLEAGCGIGNMLVIFGKMGFEVSGIEIDGDRVFLAQKNCSRYGVEAEIIQGDVRKLPYQNGSFDFIFSGGTVEHFEGTEIALDEMFRVLKPGGYSMISVPNRISFFRISKRMQEIIGRVTGKELWRVGFEKSYFPRQFKKMLEKSGFEVVEVKFRESVSGKRYPIVGKILRAVDKPLVWFFSGGHFMEFFCQKPK